ncbi:hypothetical protein [Rhizobium grahamii]
MMRQAARPNAKTARVSPSFDWVAPTGGWRTDIEMADMPKDAAFQLDNFFPESNRVRARYGSQPFATGLGGDVQTIIPYSGALNKLFATAGSGLFDITGGGAVGAPVVSGLGSAHWSAQQFTNAGGQFIRMVNGVDTPLLYNGSVWSTTAITGITNPNALLAVTAYRSRLWFIEKNSTNVWYLATDAVSGAATLLNVGGNMKYGGVLTAIGVWTIPVSTGIQQTLAIMTTEGELLVYTGSNPADAANWSFVGSFKLGNPIGFDRCLLNVGADLAIMTTDGIIPITKAVQLDRGATDLGAITKPIGPTWLDTVASVGTSSNQWQLSAFPKRRMAIVNLPNDLGAYQYVMNTETGAWCRFVGFMASCWGTWEERLFFGANDGTVYEAEVGASDSGTAIDALMVGAWSRFGDGISPKYSKAIGATTQIGPNTTMYAGVSVDYQTSVPLAVLSTVPVSASSRWGTAVWGQSHFPGTTLTRTFATAGGTGVALAPTIRALISGDSGSVSEAGVIGGTILYERGQPI